MNKFNDYLEALSNKRPTETYTRIGIMKCEGGYYKNPPKEIIKILQKYSAKEVVTPEDPKTKYIFHPMNLKIPLSKLKEASKEMDRYLKKRFPDKDFRIEFYDYFTKKNYLMISTEPDSRIWFNSGVYEKI